MEQREDESQVGGDRRLASEHQLDLLLHREVPVVDLVVEGDDLVAQLDVLRPQCIHDSADRSQNDLAGFLEASFEGVQLGLQLDSHPNLPVT